MASLTSGSLLLITTLVLQPPSERPTPVLTPSKVPVGEPAIAPAVIDNERQAAPEPTLAEPVEPEPTVVVQQPEGELPSWSDTPSSTPRPHVTPDDGATEPGDGALPSDETPIADWTTPVSVTAPEPTGPRRGWGLISVAGGVFGGMVVTQLITGLTCEDVYCGTRGWGWRSPRSRWSASPAAAGGCRASASRGIASPPSSRPRTQSLGARPAGRCSCSASAA